MNLLDLARQIATPDQAARRQAIMAQLPVFVHKRQRFNDDGKDYYPENIMVPPQRDEPFIVLGAHYDSVAGSSGANDNAASVAILLHLLKANYAFNTPLEYAFFDLEEQGVVGSRAYLSSSPDKRRIKAMVNLDICGVGDTLLIAAGQHAIGTPYHMAAQKAIEDASFPAQLIPLMPPSDDVSFDQYRIPSLSICMVPAADVPLMPAFAAAMHSHNANAQLPSVVDTMHNRPNDNVEVLQERAMWHVTHFLLSLIGHIKALTQA